MTSLLNDIQDKLKHLNAFEKIIAANVVVFVLGWLILKVVNSTANSLHWLELPKRFVSDFIYQPWSIITYGFAHYGFLHFAINMMVLYFIAHCSQFIQL